MPDRNFDLLLFHRELDTSVASLQAGVGGIIVDLENQGKQQRQLGYDTEINRHQVEDLRALRRKTDGRLLCRVAHPAPNDPEIAAVIDAGADEIIVPMLTGAAQAERFLRRVDGACRVMLMIETRAAVAEIEQIAHLPADRIYVGLNDLRIDRASPTIFEPLADGLLNKLRTHCQDRMFGFGGLTLPNHGAPLHGKHLYQEMARLDCHFTFLRRSFYRDVAGLDFAMSLNAIQAEMARYRKRTAAECQRDNIQTVQAVRELESSAFAV